MRTATKPRILPEQQAAILDACRAGLSCRAIAAMVSAASPPGYPITPAQVRYLLSKTGLMSAYSRPRHVPDRSAEDEAGSGNAKRQPPARPDEECYERTIRNASWKLYLRMRALSMDTFASAA